MSSNYLSLIKQAHSLHPNDCILKMFELRKQFEAEPDSTEKWRALGQVYYALGLYQSAYNVYFNIENARERWKKVDVQHLKTMAEDYGNSRAQPLPLPITPELKASLPTFDYCSDPLEVGVLKALAEPVICDCCGKETHVFYDGVIYCIEKVGYLCPDCIATGKAAKKFNGEFIVHYAPMNELENISDEKFDNLIYRTPSYTSWQEAYWANHCSDFCDFVGYADWERIKPLLDNHQLDFVDENLRDSEMLQYLTTNGSFVGYLFQCKSCSQYVLYTDND